MGGEDAIRNLFYTSSDPSVEFKMQLNVGAKGQVMPPGGGSAVVGWPILSGSSITFKGPDGIVTQPIQPGSGQSLVDGPGCLFGIGAQGPSIGGVVCISLRHAPTENLGFSSILHRMV